MKRCLEQKRFRRRSRFGHYHADPSYTLNTAASFVIQHTPVNPVSTGTSTSTSTNTTDATATTTGNAMGSSSSYYFSYKAMALEIQAAEYFLPKGRASLYPPFGPFSSSDVPGTSTKVL